MCIRDRSGAARDRPREGEVASGAAGIGQGLHRDGPQRRRTLVCLLRADMPCAGRSKCRVDAPRGRRPGRAELCRPFDGRALSGARAYRAASRRFRTAQRRISRRVKGSQRREKAGLLLARLHQRVHDLRRSRAHQLSRRRVAEFGLIAVEDLQLRGLTRGYLAKDISDQGWAEFLTLLGYKAEDAGIQVVRVPPSGTSQTCSDCGTSVRKTLAEPTHSCPFCQLVIDRDVNAARNILRLGLSRQATTWATGGVRSLRRRAWGATAVIALAGIVAIGRRRDVLNDRDRSAREAMATTAVGGGMLPAVESAGVPVRGRPTDG